MCAVDVIIVFSDGNEMTKKGCFTLYVKRLRGLAGRQGRSGQSGKRKTAEPL